MSQLPPDEQAIFEQALKIPSLEEQAKFVAKTCGEDLQMLKRIRDRLRASDGAKEITLDSPVIGGLDVTQDSDFTTAESSQPEFAVTPGTIVAGRYKLLETIGEGGMGSVWLAQQSEPVKRKVAIKLIKPGMDSRQVLARFDAERQALALMDHPGIAKVFDGGLTDQGRPFFAMEYVQGAPLTEYCDQARLSVRERLELFVVICQAVQHAHQKGIIHRDLKPSNIIVRKVDGKAVAKVIDFGLAKAMHQPLTEQTLHTAHGMVVGTPLYMSPEQALSENLDIDTRADIYSLGVLLYELLTGTTPLTRAKIKEAVATEIVRLIREFEPPKPSTRLSSSESLPSVAAMRSIDPAHLKRNVSGDLDWVVMKALEKERDRRYETANGFAADIMRHLNDEPVMASPPSRTYRMKKFIKRNRASVIAASLMMLLLMAGVIGTTSGLLWALSENERAEAATIEANKAKDGALASADREKIAAQKAKVAAEREKQRADELEQVAGFQESQLSNIEITQMAIRVRAKLTQILEENLDGNRSLNKAERESQLSEFKASLAGVDMVRFSKDVLNQNVFNGALKAIEQFDNQPVVKAMLLQSIASTLSDVELWERAVEPQEEAVLIFRKELDPDDPRLFTSLIEQATLLESRGKYEEAENVIREAVAKCREILGDDNEVFFEALQRLASILGKQEKFAEAKPYFEQVLSGFQSLAGNADPRTVTAKHNLAYVVEGLDDLEQAEQLYREALDDAIFPGISQLSNLGHLLAQQGEYSESADLLITVVELNRLALGEDNSEVLRAANTLGAALTNLERFDEAEDYLDMTLRNCLRVFPANHPNIMAPKWNLAMCLLRQGKLEDGMELGLQARETARRLMGNGHPNVVNMTQSMANMHNRHGQHAKAEPLARECLEMAMNLKPENTKLIASSLFVLGDSELNQNKFVKAEEHFRESLSVRESDENADPKVLLAVQMRTAAAIAGQGKFDEAVSFMNLEQFEKATPEQVVTKNADSDITCIKIIIKIYEDRNTAEPDQGYDVKAANWRKRLNELKPKEK